MCDNISLQITSPPAVLLYRADSLLRSDESAHRKHCMKRCNLHQILSPSAAYTQLTSLFFPFRHTTKYKQAFFIHRHRPPCLVAIPVQYELLDLSPSCKILSAKHLLLKDGHTPYKKVKTPEQVIAWMLLQVLLGSAKHSGNNRQVVPPKTPWIWFCNQMTSGEAVCGHTFPLQSLQGKYCITESIQVSE